MKISRRGEQVHNNILISSLKMVYAANPGIYGVGATDSELVGASPAVA